jgi:hypothetical protein
MTTEQDLEAISKNIASNVKLVGSPCFLVDAGNGEVRALAAKSRTVDDFGEFYRHALSRPEDTFYLFAFEATTVVDSGDVPPNIDYRDIDAVNALPKRTLYKIRYATLSGEA